MSFLRFGTVRFPAIAARKSRDQFSPYSSPSDPVKRATLAALLATGALGLGASLGAPEAKALCLPGGAPNPCTFFNPQTNSQVIRQLFLNEPGQLKYLQAAPASSNPQPQKISSIAYSMSDPGVNFNAASFIPMDAQLFTNLSPAYNPGTVVNVTAPVAGSSIWVRYQIDASPTNTLVDGDGVQLAFVGNNNGDKQGTQYLSSDGKNFYFATVFQHLAEVPKPTEVPAPLPLLGAGAAFGFSRRLRRRAQAQAQARA